MSDLEYVLLHGVSGDPNVPEIAWINTEVSRVVQTLQKKKWTEIRMPSKKEYKDFSERKSILDEVGRILKENEIGLARQKNGGKLYYMKYFS